VVRRGGCEMHPPRRAFTLAVRASRALDGAHSAWPIPCAETIGASAGSRTGHGELSRYALRANPL